MVLVNFIDGYLCSLDYPSFFLLYALAPSICWKCAKFSLKTIGQIIQNIFSKVIRKIFVEWKLSKLGSWSLLIIIWQTFDQAFETGAFNSVKGNNMVFIVFISIIFYTSWTITCFLLSRLWLSKADTIAVAYVVPAKTPAMGVPLSNVMFAGLLPITASKVQIPMVVFQGLQIAAGSVLTLVFRKWIGSGEGEEKDTESGRQRHQEDQT